VNGPAAPAASQKTTSEGVLGCQQGVSGSHGYSTQSKPPFRAEIGHLAAKSRNSPHSPALAPRDHNPRVGGSSPSSGIDAAKLIRRLQMQERGHLADEIPPDHRDPQVPESSDLRRQERKGAKGLAKKLWAAPIRGRRCLLVSVPTGAADLLLSV
jgi:hypothetical protein